MAVYIKKLCELYQLEKCKATKRRAFPLVPR